MVVEPAILMRLLETTPTVSVSMHAVHKTSMCKVAGVLCRRTMANHAAVESQAIERKP